MTRVVVTGLGVVSNVGAALDEFWSALAEGRGRFRVPPNVDSIAINAGVVDDRHLADNPPRTLDGRFDRNSNLAIAACLRALKEAGLAERLERPDRVAVVLGAGSHGATALENQYRRLFVDKLRPHPLTVGRSMVSAPASAVSIATGAKGPCFITSSACASAAHAIGLAGMMIRSGMADVAIAGGAESTLTQGSMMAWDVMRIMSRSLCRPFALGRDGLLLSEGAGALILESEAHARARGASTEIEYAGFGCSADAGDLFQPSAEGMESAIRAALADAGMTPGDVDYINAHGTGTRSNDMTEAAAIKSVFGAASCPPLSSTKGVTGHALGAAAALEAVATVLALRRQMAPPTANFDAPDPECDVDCIPNQAREMPIDVALSNSFAFGGLNATLAFRRRPAGL